MRNVDEMHTAMVNRSIRTIKAELEYLCDAAVISPQTLNELLNQIPPQTALRAPLSVGATPQAIAAASQSPNSAFNNLSIRDEPTGASSQSNNRDNNNNNNNSTPAPQNNYYEPPSSQPPPAWSPPPPQANWPPLAQATALYAYTPTDPTDLELQPNDHISVVEYMNAEWWKGRSERTGRTGIFPRSYVRVNDEKGGDIPPTPQPSNYGNMPLDVSQQNVGGKAPNQGLEMGKKIGKKFGNAAIFGAGATFGADIVNSIL